MRRHIHGRQDDAIGHSIHNYASHAHNTATVKPSVFANQTALITGASSGIGAALARRLAKDGAHVILVARRRERLDAVVDEIGELAPGSRALAMPADLTEPRECDRLAAEALASGPVDILINNAGTGAYGRFAEADLETTDRMLRLNMIGLTRLTRLILPGMIERRGGWILNVASMAVFQPMPFMSAYAASKAYVMAMSRSLREEVRGQGVFVTCLCPGLTRTEFFDHGDYGRLRKLIDRRAADPGDVADSALRALAAGKAVCVPGLGNRLTVMAERLIPTTLLGRFMRRALKPS